MNKYLV